jgi:hypothetical protein
MIKLNLKATTKEQQQILNYLQENVSENLADKINNGIIVQQDGNAVLNKKDLNSFMKFACDEAKKQAEKGANSAMIAADVVYGWAVHYFEEDSIIGKLYNEDGTEYKPAVKGTPNSTPKTATPHTMPQIKKSEPQMSLFDLQDDEDNCPEDIPKITQEEVKTPEPKKGNDMYMRYLAIKQKYDDCIVLYRLGDFYEMFNSDAITAAEILNLTLTSRDVGLDERIPMAGLPYHAVDPYMQKLIESGYKVAICEPLGDTYSERVINPAETPVQEIDEETGEIIHEDNDTELYTALSFDKEDMLYLYDLLDGDMDIE